MALIKREPRSFLNPLYEEWPEVTLREFLSAFPRTERTETCQWIPRVDIKEDEKQFTVVVDVPGVDPKNIGIYVENGVLTVKGERETEKRASKEGYTRVERECGSFYRQFTLPPESADIDNIQADGEHGVLKIVIPKRKQTVGRKIQVRE